MKASEANVLNSAIYIATWIGRLRLWMKSFIVVIHTEIKVIQDWVIKRCLRMCRVKGLVLFRCGPQNK